MLGTANTVISVVTVAKRYEAEKVSQINEQQWVDFEDAARLTLAHTIEALQELYTSEMEVA